MKKSYLFLIVLSFLMASCIPSLHPIFTEQDRVQDDRIIGNWIHDPDNYVAEGVKINKRDMSLDINQLSFSQKSDSGAIEQLEIWNFDRAADMRYVKTDAEGISHNTMSEEIMMHRSDSALLAQGFVLDTIEKLPYYVLEYSSLVSERAHVEKMAVVLTQINGDHYMDFAPLESVTSEEVTRFSINNIPGHTFAKFVLEDDKLVIKPFNSDYIEDLIRQKRIRLKHENVNGTIILTASTQELRKFIEKYGNDAKLYEEEVVLSISRN